MADIRVGWVQFDTLAVTKDVRVGWAQFDTLAVTKDVRVGWAQFDTLVAHPLTSIGGGGGYPPKYHPWIHKRVKEKLHDIAELQPELADAVIEAVATVTEKRTVQNKDLETAQAEKELRKFLKSQEQRWKKEYAQLILLEYERIEQEYEDAQIAMLLFDM